MPHSSGGGSHSGGSHSGSSHSGSSSHSSSSHSSHSSYRRSYTKDSFDDDDSCSFPPFTNQYNSFYNLGYVKYINGIPQYRYFFCPKERHIKEIKQIIAVMIAILILASSLCIFLSVKMPIRNNPGQCEIISENTNIGPLLKLQPSINEFKNKTGINVCIVLDDNSWQENYKSCKQYAYDLYIHLFHNNEKNWLIVYTQDEVPNNINDENYEEWRSSKFSDWHWEGMQGDETDKILDEDALRVFNSTLNRELTYANGNSEDIGNAFVTAFETLNSVVMKKQIDPDTVLPIIFIVAFLFFILLIELIRDMRTLKNYKEMSEVPSSSIVDGKILEDKCDYCGGIYAIGTVTQCPCCGATLMPHNRYGNKF